MEIMAEELREASLEFGLKINSAKTNAVRIGGDGQIRIDKRRQMM